MQAYTVQILDGARVIVEYDDILARDESHACDRTRWRYEIETGQKSKHFSYIATKQEQFFSDTISLRVEHIYCVGGMN